MKSETSLIAYLLVILIAPSVAFGVLSVFKTSEPVVLDEAALLKLAETGTGQSRVDALLKLGTAPEDLPAVVEVLARASVSNTDVVQSSAVLSLKKIGVAASDHLEPLFSSGKQSDYLAGCTVIHHLGSNNMAWKKVLAEGMDSKSTIQRRGSLFAFAGWPEQAADQVPKMIKMLDDPDMNVRVWSCRALEAIGPAASQAAPRLIYAMNNDVVSVKGRAAMALGSLGKSKEYDVVEILGKKLNAFTQVEKERALIGLRHLGADARPLLPEIDKLMKTPMLSCVVPAATTRWKVTGEKGPSVDALVKMLGSLSYRKRAAEELSLYGPAAKPAVKKLIEFVEAKNEILKDDTGLQEAAIITLGKIGPDARDAISELKSVARSSTDALLRYAAEESISQIKRK